MVDFARQPMHELQPMAATFDQLAQSVSPSAGPDEGTAPNFASPQP
jgi:hypothetical protein